ncbi:MAG TPA: putative sulfate exporter family transporter [Anaerolineaceae bacterium]
MKQVRKITAIEQNLLGVRIEETPGLLPGLALCAVLAALSIWLADFIGINLLGFEKSPISAVIVAILLGLIVGNLVPLPAWIKPGFNFAVRKVLRLGIILLGIRLSIYDVFKLGALGVPIVVLCITGALLLTDWLARWLKLPQRLGTLIAVGTSICGASAIVATSPSIDAKEEEIAYAVAVITLFGILATLLYPYAAHQLFQGDALKAGLFLGTSIHETAQVSGAGLVYSEVFSSPQALNVATVTKLVRNTLMVAVVPLMAYFYSRRSEGKTKKKISIIQLFPLFILGFLATAILRTIGDAFLSGGSLAYGIWNAAGWKAFHTTTATWASNFLVVALASVGLTTRYSILKGLGIKPLLVGLFAALMVGLISYLAINLLGGQGVM